MNFWEAFKSKRPFKRPYWEYYCVLGDKKASECGADSVVAFYLADSGNFFGYLDTVDLAADDYIIQKKQVSMDYDDLKYIQTVVCNAIVEDSIDESDLDKIAKLLYEKLDDEKKD